MIQTISNKVVTARKPHKCAWCGREIKPGDKYRKAVCKEDTIYNFNTCLECNVIYHSLCDWWGEYELDDQEFSEMCQEFAKEFMCKACQGAFCDQNGDCDDLYKKIYIVLKKYEFIYDVETRTWFLRDGYEEELR